jgi:hypothetical protein
MLKKIESVMVMADPVPGPSLTIVALARLVVGVLQIEGLNALFQMAFTLVELPHLVEGCSPTGPGTETPGGKKSKQGTERCRRERSGPQVRECQPSFARFSITLTICMS